MGALTFPCEERVQPGVLGVSELDGEGVHGWLVCGLTCYRHHGYMFLYRTWASDIHGVIVRVLFTCRRYWLIRVNQRVKVLGAMKLGIDV
jgi:hypothetical protein